MVYSGSKAGDMPVVDFTPLGVVTQPSFLVRPYTLLNTNLSYRWGRTTFAWFVDNLFDVDRITQAGGRAGLGLAFAFRRNVRFSTSIEF
jgi:iron complex outermembrane receptor protein